MLLYHGKCVRGLLKLKHVICGGEKDTKRYTGFCVRYCVLRQKIRLLYRTYGIEHGKPSSRLAGGNLIEVYIMVRLQVSLGVQSQFWLCCRIAAKTMLKTPQEAGCMTRLRILLAWVRQFWELMAFLSHRVCLHGDLWQETWVYLKTAADEAHALQPWWMLLTCWQRRVSAQTSEHHLWILLCSKPRPCKWGFVIGSVTYADFDLFLQLVYAKKYLMLKWALQEAHYNNSWKMKVWRRSKLRINCCLLPWRSRCPAPILLVGTRSSRETTQSEISKLGADIGVDLCWVQVVAMNVQMSSLYQNQAQLYHTHNVHGV